MSCTQEFTAQTDLFFRTYLHTAVPLHQGLVGVMCGATKLPLELATVLEDIGQAYSRMASTLHRELMRRGDDAREPDPDDSGEAKIDAFIDGVIARMGQIDFHDGTFVNVRRAVEAFPAAADALRTALLIEKRATTA